MVPDVPVYIMSSKPKNDSEQQVDPGIDYWGEIDAPVTLPAVFVWESEAPE
jgi:hypothetical protein